MSRSAFRNLVREARFCDFPLDKIQDFVQFVYKITTNVFAGKMQDIRYAKITKYTECELFHDFLLKRLPYIREVGENQDKRHEFVLRVNGSSVQFQLVACNAQEVLAGLGDWYLQLESKLRVVWLTGVEHRAAFAPSETLLDLKAWINELHPGTAGADFLLATAMPSVVLHDLDQPLLLYAREKLVCKPACEVQVRQVVETQKQEQVMEATALRQAEFAKQQQIKLAAKAQIEHKRQATIQKFATDRPVAEAKAQREIKKQVKH
ncbi:hypothetical protein BASA81_012120 [Batrachochytrium salamandrivorans]|nr:hypothetical protein BASA81_012120 [Batrachochytrium salamandrivorans]